MALKPHASCSPMRPPMEHLYFTILDPEGDTVFFATHAFGAIYAVNAWLEEIMQPNPDIKTNWPNDVTITLTHTNGYCLSIKGTDPASAIEYTPTREESQWIIPSPDSRLANRLSKFYLSKPALVITEEKKPKEVKEPEQPKRHKTQKPAPDGMVTVPQLCEELGLAPNKGRGLLRKAKIAKPKSGWTFKAGDPIIEEIRKVLAAG